MNKIVDNFSRKNATEYDFLAHDHLNISVSYPYLEFVPEEVKNFYADLTDEDKIILKEVAAKHDTYENEDQALEALKAKSEKLYNKAKDLRNLVRNKIDSLNPEAKTFVTNVSLALVISKE